MNHPEHAGIQSPHLRDAVGVDSCWRGYCTGLPSPALEFGKDTLGSAALPDPWGRPAVTTRVTFFVVRIHVSGPRPELLLMELPFPA